MEFGSFFKFLIMCTFSVKIIPSQKELLEQKIKKKIYHTNFEFFSLAHFSFSQRINDRAFQTFLFYLLKQFSSARLSPQCFNGLNKKLRSLRSLTRTP